MQVARTAAALADAGAEVAVDFTVVDAARGNLEWCADNGVHAVVGTTGFSDDDLDHIRDRFGKGSAERSDRAELRHRRRPHDAVRRAGGALLRVGRGHRAPPRREARRAVGHRDAHRGAHGRGVGVVDCRSHARSSSSRARAAPKVRSGIRVHSVRLRGLVAHQEVLLGTTGQSLSIRHDSYDRSSFMPGVLLAIRAVREKAGLTVGLDTLLGL